MSEAAALAEPETETETETPDEVRGPAFTHPDQIVQHLYDFVNVFEDPLEGTNIVKEDLTPEAVQILDRMHALAKKSREQLVMAPALGEVYAFTQLGWLHAELAQDALGKSFFKRAVRAVEKVHKTIAKKIEKVAKNPIFLAVAGAVVNVIPGVGQLASAALLAAAASRKVYEQKVEQKKAKKAANAQQAQANAQYQQQLVQYNQQVAAQYAAAGQPIPVGALLDANGNASVDPRTVPGYQSSWNAVLPPGAPPSPGMAPSVLPASTTSSGLVAAAAMAGAAGLNDPSGQAAASANQIFSDLPPDIAQEAAQAIPAMQTAMQDPNVKAAQLKAIGQFVAAQELALGTGTQIGTPQQVALARGVLQQGDATVQAAITAAEQDLVTSGAVAGSPQTIQKALADGRASLLAVPWTTYAMIGAGVVGVGTGAFIILRH